MRLVGWMPPYVGGHYGQCRPLYQSPISWYPPVNTSPFVLLFFLSFYLTEFPWKDLWLATRTHFSLNQFSYAHLDNRSKLLKVQYWRQRLPNSSSESFCPKVSGNMWKIAGPNPFQSQLIQISWIPQTVRILVTLQESFYHTTSHSVLLMCSIMLPQKRKHRGVWGWECRVSYYWVSRWNPVIWAGTLCPNYGWVGGEKAGLVIVGLTCTGTRGSAQVSRSRLCLITTGVLLLAFNTQEPPPASIHSQWRLGWGGEVEGHELVVSSNEFRILTQWLSLLLEWIVTLKGSSKLPAYSDATALAKSFSTLF